MSTCLICKREIVGLVWKSAHTHKEYCGKCMFDTHLDPSAKLDVWGNPRQRKSKSGSIESQPYFYGDKH